MWSPPGTFPNKIFKIPRAGPGGLPTATTEYDGKVDWIIGTSVRKANPTGVDVIRTPSDHRIVAQTLRATFADLAAAPPS